jgi:hypothetical protein
MHALCRAHTLETPQQEATMPATTSVYDIEIDATDAAAAIDLEIRLAHLTATTIGQGNDWIVEIAGPANLEEIEAVVRDWLDDLGQTATTMRAAGRLLRLEGRRAPKHPPAPLHEFSG